MNESQNMAWKRHLTRYAKLHRMCNDNQAYLGACEIKGDAIRLYKQTIDWALKEQYPSLEFLRKEMSDQQRDGLFIDHVFNGETLIDHQCYIFHNCRGHIEVGLNLDKGIIPMLYFANGCDMTIEGIEINSPRPLMIPVYVFGDNDIKRVESDKIKYSIKNQAVKPIKEYK